MKIIPAIDIIGGQCVRLSEGDYATKKVYYSDPLEAALQFEAAGLDHLHLVDLDGAKASAVVNWEILGRIANNTGLHIDFSGGIKTEEQMLKAFDAGAAQVTLGSLCVKSPETVKGWLKQYGAEKIIIGADVKQGFIAVNGWQKSSSRPLMDFIREYLDAGAVSFLCTDVSKDGRLEGPATELYHSVLTQFPDVQLIASGGVATLEDLHALHKIGCHAAIVGKAIYEGRVTLEELAEIHG